MEFMEKIAALPLGAELATFLVSMIPVIELRGAIPIGVSLGLRPLAAMLISMVGNMVPVPFIIIFIRRIFMWLKKRVPRLGGFIERMEKKAESKREFIEKWKILGLTLFVAIPLPGTGAWTGALFAALLDIRLKRAIPSILIGVFIAGCIVLAITYGITSIV